MIAILSGVVIQKSPTSVILDVGGVGYELQVSLRSGQSCQEELPAKFYTYLAVREDSLTLFGFADPSEKEVFLALIDVNGIGPKMAQRILSEASPQELVQWISEENVIQLTKLKGIGKKTAELLVLQLRNKFNAFENKLAIGKSNSIVSEAVMALVSLGLKEMVAQKAVERALKTVGEQADVGSLITEALKFS